MSSTTSRDLKTASYAAALDTVLETSNFPENLESMTAYRRLHDDHDGTGEGIVQVVIAEDGDVWLCTDSSESLRFRTFFGGGGSLRTRSALLVLAEAIRRDNEARPGSRGNG